MQAVLLSLRPSASTPAAGSSLRGTGSAGTQTAANSPSTSTVTVNGKQRCKDCRALSAGAARAPRPTDAAAASHRTGRRAWRTRVGEGSWSGWRLADRRRRSGARGSALSAGGAGGMCVRSAGGAGGMCGVCARHQSRWWEGVGLLPNGPGGGAGCCEAGGAQESAQGLATGSSRSPPRGRCLHSMERPLSVVGRLAHADVTSGTLPPPIL